MTDYTEKLKSDLTKEFSIEISKINSLLFKSPKNHSYSDVRSLVINRLKKSINELLSTKYSNAFSLPSNKAIINNTQFSFDLQFIENKYKISSVSADTVFKTDKNSLLFSIISFACTEMDCNMKITEKANTGFPVIIDFSNLHDFFNK